MEIFEGFVDFRGFCCRGDVS